MLGPGVAYDLIERAQTFGGTQDYRAYLSAKVNLGPVRERPDLTFTVAGRAGARVLAVRGGCATAPWSCRCRLLAVIVALAYSLGVPVPLAYLRMAYYLPLALAAGRGARARLAAQALRVLAGAPAACSWRRSPARLGAGRERARLLRVHEPASLRGLDAVRADLRPREVVVTDRCWSFQATWLLHTRTLPALEPEDIQPKAELRARQAPRRPRRARPGPGRCAAPRRALPDRRPDLPDRLRRAPLTAARRPPGLCLHKACDFSAGAELTRHGGDGLLEGDIGRLGSAVQRQQPRVQSPEVKAAGIGLGVAPAEVDEAAQPEAPALFH